MYIDLVGPVLGILDKIFWTPISQCVKHHRSLDENIKILNEKSIELNKRKDDIESQINVGLDRGKTVKKEVELWLQKVNQINDDKQHLEQEIEKAKFISRSRLGRLVSEKIHEVVELHHKGAFSDVLMVDAVPNVGKLLSTPRFVGESTAQRKLEAIWTSLATESIRKVGVYGMGGSGKTTMIRHIYNRVIEHKDKFDAAIWISMPKATDVINIQSHIAKAVYIDSEMGGDDAPFRAARIYHALQRKKRWVIFLDDMWEAFNLGDVGIPEPSLENGCKLVLTTRSLKVCQLMSCESIKIELLSEGEAWNLFLDNVGRIVPMTRNLEAIAKQVAKECARLPLAIITVGRSMNGVVDEREWKNALYELRKSLEGFSDMGKVIQQLKFSYTYLENEKLRRALLCCALYPEDYRIKREELIAYLIDEEIIKGTGSREQSFDEGHTILNKLENACLLENCTNESIQRVRMHDIVRDMALQIMGPRSMVEAGVGLRDFPNKQKWPENLETVSLMYNDMTVIYPDESPKCITLKTLLLFCNKKLKEIPDKFFEHIPNLRILDISSTNLRIFPKSISDMEHLTVLRLKGCTVLRYLPSLAKLQGLKELDLSMSTISELHGLEMLVNLQYLNLYLCEHLRMFEIGILPKLRQLQYLNLYFGYNNLYIKGQELACLMKLETVVCQFETVTDLNTYVSSTMIQQRRLPSSFILHVGPHNQDMQIKFMEDWGDGQHQKYIGVSKHSINRYEEEKTELIVFLPEVDEFSIRSWDNLSSLSSVLAGQELQHYSGFRHLKKLYIDQCREMKKLFTPKLVPHLQNLEEIHVKHCLEMEEIFAATEDERSNEAIINCDNLTITLPKLRVLELDYLPKLESIVCRKAVVAFDSIQHLKIFTCPKLKRLPFDLSGRRSPPSSLIYIWVSNEAWWDSLKWDNAITKKVLKKFLCIGGQSATV